MRQVPSFDELLSSATRSAVHLEMRDVYAVVEEAGELKLWRSGRWTLDDGRRALGEWMELVASVAKRGVAVRRARIVSEPVTDYIKYEHALTPLNVRAGEEVRWLPRRQALGIPLPAADFWLIDDRLVRFNHFSGAGEAVEPEMSEDPKIAALCSSAFEAVWNAAVPHDKFEV
ncbi:DUF6879 family protein [Streptomyces litchfieldiae]|uniref:DUF6879 domain-containing protein n=1 Tax=Streptomyces litchfieldiae TaxID=3075543 RepID=A0ABU2MKE1_9ACTN|nr:DUF6879 family protein [Streptomyces sp. DSM 44938]MDT0341579.1 hypothetical protein [Streptomyces sp. DSM 44938]